MYNYTLYYAAQITLTPTEVSACPGDEVVFTCQSTQFLLTWAVTAPADATNVVYQARNYLTPMQSDVGQPEPLGCMEGGSMCSEDVMFMVELTSSSSPIASRLTTTAANALNGTTVQCRGTSLETAQTSLLQLLSKELETKQVSYLVTNTWFFRSPASPRQSYHHGGRSDGWHHLSYSYSTVGSQY